MPFISAYQSDRHKKETVPVCAVSPGPPEAQCVKKDQNRTQCFSKNTKEQYQRPTKKSPPSHSNVSHHSSLNCQIFQWIEQFSSNINTVKSNTVSKNSAIHKTPKKTASYTKQSLHTCHHSPSISEIKHQTPTPENSVNPNTTSENNIPFK